MVLSGDLPALRHLSINVLTIHDDDDDDDDVVVVVDFLHVYPHSALRLSHHQSFQRSNDSQVRAKNASDDCFHCWVFFLLSLRTDVNLGIIIIIIIITCGMSLIRLTSMCS